MQGGDQVVQRADGIAVFQQRPDRSFPAQVSKGRARRTAQGDEEPGGVVEVNLQRVEELLVEPEADDHGYVPVDLQLPPLAELL
jgi:hypothetical protein